MRKPSALLLVLVILASGTVLVQPAWIVSGDISENAVVPVADLAELTDQKEELLKEKLLVFLKDVVGVDTGKYETYIVDYSSEHVFPPVGPVVENVTYLLESPESELRIKCAFINSTLVLYQLHSYAGVIQYVDPLPDDVIDAARVILERRQVLSSVESRLLFQEAISLLGRITELKTENISNGMMLRVVKEGNVASFTWGFESSGVSGPYGAPLPPWWLWLTINFTNNVLSAFSGGQEGIFTVDTTLTIRSDGSVDGSYSERVKIERDGDIYTFVDNVYGELVVERDSIVVDGAGYSIQGSFRGVDLSYRHNVTIKNIEVKTELSQYGIATGIYLESASNNKIIDCSIIVPFNPQIAPYSVFGIYMISSSNNEITDNRIALSHGDQGLIMYQDSSNNFVTGNEFVDCGIRLLSYHNTIEGNTLNGKPVVYFEGASGQVIGEDVGQVILVNCDNMKVENLVLPFVGIQLLGTTNTHVTNNEAGIFLVKSNENVVSNNRGVIEVRDCEDNTFFKNSWWIEFFSVNNTLVYGNEGGFTAAFSANINITGNEFSEIRLQNTVNCLIYSNKITGGGGIAFSASINNTITHNLIANCSYGLYLRYASLNTIYGNNFVDNDRHVANLGSINTWDDGSKGNYWSDYTTRYPNASELNGMGVWDTPYEIAVCSCLFDGVLYGTGRTWVFLC
jgi:parallel beta-helix repeat protein